jgi:hypothetical protein
VKTKHMTSKNALPRRVPFSATPPGETPEISAWAQHIVWTDRMLSTLLENKVRGGKWHTLIDKVYAPANLYTADSRTESFAFLGYSFRGEKIYPRRESLAKLKARLVKLTSRTRPGSIEAICMELNSVLRGWFYYFRHCRWTIFADLDSKIRRRLRRLLLRRHRNNPTRSPRQERWPNDYFTKAGLFSLREAHNRFGQSHQGHY